MAKIPQYQQSTLPPGGEDFPGGTFAPIYFAEEVGSSINRAGQSLANLGNAIADVHIKQQKAQEALDISNALADLQVRIDEAYQKHKLEEQDPVLFESRFQESANTIFEDVLSKQTKNVARNLQPYIKELSGRYQIRAKSDALKKQVDIGRAQRITSAELLNNTALEGYKQGDFEAGYEAIQKYDALLELHKTTGLIGPDDAAAESLQFKKQITRNGYLLAIQNDPENALQRLQDSPDPFLDPLARDELIGTASKAIMQLHDTQQKAEKEAYTQFVETSVQDAFAGKLDIDTINSPDFKSKFKDPADYDKVVRARQQPEASDPDALNKLTYRINLDPYSLTPGDIVSAEGISISDKNKAIEELQRSQEITNRPNYKAARELFDIDFKQKFGEDLAVDPAEEKAKWLRVFHSYIIDKKMEPLDAAEKIRKDYEQQNNPSLASPQDGNITNSSQEENIKSPASGNERNSISKQAGPGSSKTPKPEADIVPTDSLFAGIGKSIVQGLTAFPKTFWGAGAMLEDIARNIPQAIPLAAFTQIIPEDFFKRRYEDVKGIEERFQAKGEGYKKYINGAIRTMSEMLSQYAGTAGLGTLPGMSAGAGIDKYLEARKESYSIPRSFAAGGVTAATEYITEKTPLEILGRPGLKFVDRLMKGLIADIPGEIEATLVEMTAVDQAILGKSYTRQAYLRALLDTAATAALTTFGATGVTHPIIKVKSEPTGKMSSPEPAEQIMQVEITFSDFGPVFTQFKGKPKEAIEQLTKEKNGDAIGALYHKDIGDIDLVWGKEGTPEKKYEDGYGLAKIVVKHPEVVDNLQDILSETTVKSRGQNRIKLESPDHKAVIRLDWNGETKNWLLTAYEKEESPFTRGRTGVSGNLSGTPPAPQGDSSKVAANAVPPFRPLEETPSGTSETLSNPSENIISPSPESVKPVVSQPNPPDITIMPFLKGLVDTGALSLEDALEINDIARQNNWSEDTVKQFHENAIKGLGIQNKETQNLASLLVTAKIKAAVYKQHAEQYKQEIETNERLIKTLYDRLGIKIEGGAPDKYETIANDFLKNLGDLKDLKPEEIIQKAQKELALNLNRLDTGMDVKTLITAAVQTINEAEGISRETVSHEQTVNEALKELPGIYSKVINLKRGKALSRPQQLAARMLGTALFETFNKTKMLGMANPQDTKLYRQAQEQLIELGQYWSKVLASSSEIGRELEAQKIIAKVGEEIPATEEFQKVLDMLSGQKEISPEQFYQLTSMLKTPDQLSEMARELAKPVTRRIQDIFLEAWINGLLSNPQTHATNVLSNLYTTFASIPERYLAAKTHYGNNPDRVSNPVRVNVLDNGVVDGEAKAMLYGMQMGFRDAVNAARLAWATETGRFGKTAQKVENAQQKAITAENINRILGKFGVDPMNQTLSNAVDYIGKIWRLPIRALMTADEFFKMINYRMELHALAYRQAAMEGLTGDKAGTKIAELIQKPTTEMRVKAMAHANIQTFTGEMGPVAAAISGLTERVPMAKIIIPFVRTPSNIFTYALERTPFLAYARSQVRADIKAGGAARDLALGKMAFGGMLAALVATLAASGFITGSGPEDRDLKKIMRDNGWQPNSIRIGDTYYSYKRMDPVGIIIGMIADATEIMGELDDYSAGKLALAIVLSMEHNLLDNLYLDGIMNVLDAIQDPGKQWHDYFKKQAGSLIPALSGDIARGFDPVVHDTKSIIDTMRSRIPGFSIFAPAQRNIFGEKVLRGGSLGNDFISPIWQSKAKHDPVLDEIIKHKIDIHPPSRYIGGSAPSEIDPMAKDNPRAGVPLTPRQYDRLQELTGQGLREALEKLIKKPLYQKQSDGPDGGKALLIRNVIDRAKEIGRQKLLKEDQQLQEKLKAKYHERRAALQPKK